MKMETPTLVSLVLLALLLCYSLSSANLIDDLQLARHSFPKVQAEKRIRELHLSSKEDVNVIEEGRDSVAGPRIVERRFRFPNLTESAVSVEDLGHHAGYYKIAHSHDARLFYFFFESRNSNKVPVVIWLTGGPGCGSEMAMFYENGPFTIADNMSLLWNEYGWDQASNLLYVDQPTGSGFSYSSDKRDIRHDEDGVSNDLYDFLQNYDIRKKCERILCYDFSNLEKFLAQKSVRDALGVPADLDFAFLSPTVNKNMLADYMRNLEVGIPALLEDGIKLLVYAGEYDFICNWLGNSRWVHAMEWSGQKEFVASPEVAFTVHGSEAGVLKSFGSLAFLKVHDAGHMVPMDQPKAALEMLERWIKGTLSEPPADPERLAADM